MIHWVGEKLEKVGVSVEYVKTSMQKLADGQEVRYPPVLLGSLGCDPNKKTVLIYGHLDVQPALKEDGWDTDPFEVKLLVSTSTFRSGVLGSRPGYFANSTMAKISPSRLFCL